MKIMLVPKMLRNVICVRDYKELVGKIRQLYTLDKHMPSSPDHSYRSVDMQKVIMLPSLPGIKTAIFTKRLVAFHETFAPLKTLDNTIAVIWNEAISGRNANDISSVFIKAMRQENDINHFTFWIDNCGAQNKNWTFFRLWFMVYFVNSDEGPLQSITFKYLMAGHTFMTADTFHASVEKQFTIKQNVCEFSDLKEAVQNAVKHVQVVEMTVMTSKLLSLELMQVEKITDR